MSHFFARFHYPLHDGGEESLFKKFYCAFLPAKGLALVDAESTEWFTVDDITFVQEEGSEEIIVLVDLTPDNERTQEEWWNEIHYLQSKGWSEKRPFATDAPSDMSV